MSWNPTIEYLDFTVKNFPFLKELTEEKRKYIYTHAREELYRLLDNRKIINDDTVVIRDELRPDLSQAPQGLLYIERESNSHLSYDDVEQLMYDKPFITDLNADERLFLYNLAAQEIARALGGYPIDNYKADSVQSMSIDRARLSCNIVVRQPHIIPRFTEALVGLAPTLRKISYENNTTLAEVDLGVSLNVPTWDTDYALLYTDVTLQTYGGYHNYVDTYARLGAKVDTKAYSDQGRRQVPAVVQSLTASASAYTKDYGATEDVVRSVVLSWSPPSNSDVTGYIVYRDTVVTWDSPPEIVGVISAGAGKFTDLGLTTGTTYYYKVTAYNSFGEGAQQTSPISITVS